ncbi:MAG: PAS domain-containing sensor histidine kinase [bacterium]
MSGQKNTNIKKDQPKTGAQFSVKEIESISFIESIMQATNTIYFICDEKFNVVHCSKYIANLLKYEPQEFLKGKLKITDIFPKDDIKNHAKKAASAGLMKPVKHKLKLLNKNGKEIITNASSQIIKIGKSKQKYYLITFTDISRDEKAKESLLRDHSFFKVLMDNIPDTIYFKDTKSRFTLINLAQQKLLGTQKASDAYGKTDFDFFTEEHARAAFEDEKRMMKTLEPLIYKVEKIRRADGQFIWVSATKVPVYDSKKRAKGMVGISRDMTQFKEAEDQLKKLTEDLKDVIATKDKLFSIIAHDLRNPFSTLLGVAHLIVEEYNDLSEEERRMYISNLEKSAKTTYDLLENLLFWSRAQTQNIGYNPSTIIVSNLIEKNISLLSSSALSKEIKIENLIKDTPEVIADSNLIDIVIRNLISNAVKFTPIGGKIIIDSKVNGTKIYISVSDTGIGMPVEKINRLMLSKQIDSSPGTRNERGTGLGLILCKDFIEVNKGDLKINSEINKGTTITFSLPLR